MKKAIVSVVLTLIVSQLFSQPLFTYGKYAVSKEEFLRAYNKNKIAVTDKEKSLREYLDLYTKFKIKVQAAKELQLDTLQQLIFDMQSFRSQVEEGYMNDEKGLNALIDEAIQRSQQDIHVLHFYVSLNSNAGNADTLKAYKILGEVANELKQYKADNADVVAAITKKYPGVKAADMGYITALSVPYPVETLVYNMQPGQVSDPYRTKTGLHLFKNVGNRKSAGKWKVAQILLSIPPGASDTDMKALGKKADSIYNLLLAGADFAELAKTNSEDRLTYVNGGEMPEFGTGKFEPAFENHVFSLQKDGEVSKPFLTSYGYHTVKRLQHKTFPADRSDESFVYSLKQQITQDSRISAAKAKFLKEIKLKSGYKKNAAVKDADLFRYADSVVKNSVVGTYPITKKIILSFLKSSVKGDDWLNFVKDYRLNADVYKGEKNKELLDKFISTSVFEYYRKHLEEYSPEFKQQMEEFKEGNMLFEIMERNVWTKAANDSAGLLAYYQQHKNKYRWGASADILLFNASDKKSADEAVLQLRKGTDWKKIAEKSDAKIQADSGRYELTQIQVPGNTVISEGLITDPLANSGDNTTVFVKVLKIFPANQQRSFEEAKGLVINEFQNYLEEKWLQQLKNKYPIRINDQVFESLLK